MVQKGHVFVRCLYYELECYTEEIGKLSLDKQKNRLFTKMRKRSWYSGHVQHILQCSLSPTLHQHGGRWCAPITQQWLSIDALLPYLGRNQEKERNSAVLTQVMANKFIYFDTLARHAPVNSKKYAAVLSVLIKEFENRFQDCKKKSSISVCNIIFNWYKYITCKFSNGMYRVAIRYSENLAISL